MLSISEPILIILVAIFLVDEWLSPIAMARIDAGHRQPGGYRVAGDKSQTQVLLIDARTSFSIFEYSPRKSRVPLYCGCI